MAVVSCWPLWIPEWLSSRSYNISESSLTSKCEQISKGNVQILFQDTVPLFNTFPRLMLCTNYGDNELTHWGRDQIDAMSQTTFSNAFSRMKMNEFRIGFHWSLFLRFELTIFQHWFRWWLGADQATSHYLNQWWLVYWRIYASLGLNELKTISL